MYKVLPTIMLLLSVNSYSQDVKKELEKVGEEIFEMLKANDYSKIEKYLVNEQNFEDLLPYYELSEEDESKWRENKVEMVKNTREGVMAELKKSRQYCIDNKLVWEKTKNEMEINTMGQIWYSIGETGAGCDIYVYLVKAGDNWVILSVEI